jgi:hypothetical protein
MTIILNPQCKVKQLIIRLIVFASHPPVRRLGEIELEKENAFPETSSVPAALKGQ